MGLPVAHCIEPNPDIAGIGIRYSIYAQNVLTIICALIAVFDSKIDHPEEKFMKSACTTILLTTCSLLVAAFAQAAVQGLPSFYHAVIILNLSWMSALHGGTYGVIYLIQMAEGQRQEVTWIFPKIYEGLLWTRKSRPVVILTSINLTAMGAFGFLVWRSDLHSSKDALCTMATKTVLWGISHSITSPILQKVYLTLYILALPPLLNYGFLSNTLAIAFCIIMATISITMTVIIMGSVFIMFVLLLLYLFFPRNEWLREKLEIGWLYKKLGIEWLQERLGIGQLQHKLQEELKERLKNYVDGWSFGGVCSDGNLPDIHDQEHLATARVGGAFALGILSFLQISLIVNTELTISSNKGLMKESAEASWTFGQILAIVLLIFPLKDILSHLAHYSVFTWLRAPMEWLGVDLIETNSASVNDSKVEVGGSD